MQAGEGIIELPDGSTDIGALRGISHRSTANPMGNFMATNLDERYGGCPIYQSGEDDRIIYLADYRGFYIPFAFVEEIKQPERDVK